jgi:hypothetical protein
VHERCSGNTFVAVTRVVPRFQPELVHQFSDKCAARRGAALLAACRPPACRASRRSCRGLQGSLRGWRVSCACRRDLISALLTSCHIPLYFNGNLFTGFR